MEMGRLTISPSPTDLGKTLAEEDDLEFHGHRQRAQGLRRWWKELGIAERYEYARKTVFREHEIPPSKEGRKIPLRAEHVVALVDERTGGGYVNNTVGFGTVRAGGGGLRRSWRRRIGGRGIIRALWMLRLRMG